MIGGKKMRKPLRRLKIQDQLEMDEELTPDFIDDNEELTLFLKRRLNNIVVRKK